MIASMISTVVVPAITDWGIGWVIAARAFTGAAAGPLYPALHFLISRWAPPGEKGKFIATLMGGTFGTVVTWSLVGVLIEQAGWSFAFYVPALITLLFTISWYAFVYDTPKDHPRILESEKMYIEKSLGDTFSEEKVKDIMSFCKNYVIHHLISENCSILINNGIDSLLGLVDPPLRQPVGFILPADSCSEIPEHGAWFQFGALGHVGRPSLFGEDGLWIYFRLDWRCDTSEKHHVLDCS